MKLHIYIRNAEEFLQGDYNYSMRVCEYTPEEVGKWLPDLIHIGEVEIDPSAIADIDIRTAALNQLQDEEKQTRAEMQAKLDKIETRKQNLLALEYLA